MAQSLLETVEEIVAELARLSALPGPYRDGESSLPRMIGLGDGRGIYISAKADQLISDFARRRRNLKGVHQGRISAADHRGIVRRAFGPAIAKVDFTSDPHKNARSVLDDVEAAVQKDIDWILSQGVREYALGCTLFTYEDFPRLDIGPVCIESRVHWLARKSSDGKRARIGSEGRIERFDRDIAAGPLSAISKRRILKVWQGKKLPKRKPSEDASAEQDAIAAVGNCRYVCSVCTSGLSEKAGADKALLAARLALTTLSLIWEYPSDALRGLNLYADRKGGRDILSFTSDGLVLIGRERAQMPHSPWVERRELERHLSDRSGVFAAAGEAIRWLLDSGGRPKLMRTIGQALLWFHEGCREETDLMAIVSFAQCMEVLSNGGGRKGIRDLIRARLGLDPTLAVDRDGLSLAEIIDHIYDDGRNRIIHGPKDDWNKLGWDWSETRRLAEWLSRDCLVECLDLAAKHSTVDDPRMFLNAEVRA